MKPCVHLKNHRIALFDNGQTLEGSCLQRSGIDKLIFSSLWYERVGQNIWQSKGR